MITTKHTEQELQARHNNLATDFDCHRYLIKKFVKDPISWPIQMRSAPKVWKLLTKEQWTKITPEFQVNFLAWFLSFKGKQYLNQQTFVPLSPEPTDFVVDLPPQTGEYKGSKPKTLLDFLRKK